jgi:hypothetical protein
MRSKLHKFGFYLILVVFAFVATLFVGELGVTVYHIVRDGKYIARERRSREERLRRGGSGATPSACGYGNSLIAHPYLAFVQTALGPCGFGYANSKSCSVKSFPTATAWNRYHTCHRWLCCCSVRRYDRK